MFPCNCSHMLVTCPKDHDIIFINFKSTFPNIINHVIINSQSLVIILQLAATYTEVHINCLETYFVSKTVLKQKHSFMKSYKHILISCN